MYNIIKNKLSDVELKKIVDKYGIYGLITIGAGTAIYLVVDKAIDNGYSIKADLKNLKFEFIK